MEPIYDADVEWIDNDGEIIYLSSDEEPQEYRKEEYRNEENEHEENEHEENENRESEVQQPNDQVQEGGNNPATQQVENVEEIEEENGALPLVPLVTSTTDDPISSAHIATYGFYFG